MSLEALRDIADAVRDLKADKQYSSFETCFVVLESRVDALVVAFEVEMVIRAEKEKGKSKQVVKKRIVMRKWIRSDGCETVSPLSSFFFCL